MAVAIGDIFLTTWLGSCFSQRIMLTHTYEISALTGATDEMLVSEDITGRLTTVGADIMETAYRQCLPIQYTLISVSAQKIYPTRYRSYVRSRNLGGLSGVNANTANVAACISLHSDLAGRSHIANKHIGPIATVGDWVDDGALGSDANAALIQLRDQMLENVTAAGWYTATPCITHRGAVVPKADYVTGGSVKPYARVQRRRTVGLGE